MLIYKIHFSLLTLFSLLIYIFCGRGLKGRAGCRLPKTVAQTDSACDLSACGLATSLSTQLWAWPSNLCIESRQKLFYQI